MTRIATLLRTLLIVGLAVAPLSAHATASGDRDATQATAMSVDGAAMSRDDAMTACGDCPDMRDGKACPCPAACATMCALGLPFLPPAAAALSVSGQRMAFSRQEQLPSLAASPPARPPRN
jgi:hypothetical protein